ncbi:Cof-type HAD-IIB family hydrolase [Pseudogracilibacillus auburnensis]|uniref:Cof-type HAD-IIB family hydrolase n=1 Tax=Pseudogracilibacillus auburnensis TaxID=1494959 RepID=UPI0027DA1ED6|nr:Cof-type HAD-IIB family hydrolase [Pseudogracilibacillus auburnensis]
MILLRQKHLIAIDLDGTLLTDDKKISLTSKKMIVNLIEQGHIVVIATGRSNRMSILYYHELGLNTPLINSNGAVLHHPLDKKWGNYHTPLNYNTAIEIVEACYELNSKNVLAAVHDSVYLDQYDKNIAHFYGHQDDAGDKSFVVGRIKEKLKENPTLMLLYPDKNHVDTLTNTLNDLHAEIIDHRNWGEPFHIIEVMNKQMNKSEALKQVADYYQIPRERIIAFGDEGNDLEMIHYAGIGVAMGNAIDELKSLAKYVTDTNEEHGVASFLADYFKMNLSIAEPISKKQADNL